MAALRRQPVVRGELLGVVGAPPPIDTTTTGRRRRAHTSSSLCTCQVATVQPQRVEDGRCVCLLPTGSRPAMSRSAALSNALRGDGRYEGHRANHENDQEVQLPARKMLQRLLKCQQVKGAIIYLLVATVFITRLTIRTDWRYARETFQFVQAAEDAVPGIYVDDSDYCERSPTDGRSYDSLSNEPCKQRYANVGTTDELADFLSTSIVRLAEGVNTVCSGCATGISHKSGSLRLMALDDFICSDFDITGGGIWGGDGAGAMRAECTGDDSATLTGDLDWIANPSSARTPCCRNSSVIFGSLLLTANADDEISTGKGDGVSSRSFADLNDDYQKALNGEFAPEITDFIRRNINLDGHFMQVVVSRAQRVVGMNLGATFKDRGCRDLAYVSNHASASDGYNAVALLNTCWSDSLITPTVRYWSYRFDDTGALVDLILEIVFYALLGLDILHTVRTYYGLLPSHAVGAGGGWRGTCAAIVGRLFSPRFALLELPSWILPPLFGILELYFAPSTWTLLLGITQLIVFARAFAEAGAFPIVNKLVSAIGFAAADLAGLAVVIVTSCFVFALIFGQLFGVAFSSGSQLQASGGEESDWIALVLDMGNVLVMSHEINESHFKINPWGVMIMFVTMNVFFFLLLSQVVIAILVSAFENAEMLHKKSKRDQSLPVFYLDQSKPRTCCGLLIDFPLYFVIGIHPLYGASGAGLLYAICQVIAEAEVANAAATDEQIMVSSDELRRALGNVCIGGSRADGCIRRILAAHGAKLDLKKMAESEHREASAMRQLLKDSQAPVPAVSMPSAKMQRLERPDPIVDLVDRLEAKILDTNRAITLRQMPTGAVQLPPVNSSLSPIRSRNQLPPTNWMASQRRPPPLPTLYGKIRTQRQGAVAPYDSTPGPGVFS